MKRAPVTFDPGEVRAWRRLQRIPNVGPATAEDLVRLGIRSLGDLKGRDGRDLYASLCLLDGLRHDPCVEDVFHAVCAIARGEAARPWWVFSRRRRAARASSGLGGGRGEGSLPAPSPVAPRSAPEPGLL